MSIITNNSEFELHFSGHETFPLRQMWLKKVSEQADKKGYIEKSIFTDEDSVTRFGVGKNMVASIKHWTLACGIMEESNKKSAYKLSDLGKKLFTSHWLDPYSEHISTSWLMHWQLCGQRNFDKHRSTTWYLLFNTYILPEFTIPDIISHIKKYIANLQRKKTAETTIKRDVETCIKCYSPRCSSKSIEDITEPLLAELELIKLNEAGKLSFRRGPKSNLSDHIFDYALISYWQAVVENESSLALDDITFGTGSPGRVFKLDEDSVAERLFGLEERTNGIFMWTSSSGIRQIIMSQKLTPQKLEKLKIEKLEKAYL